MMVHERQVTIYCAVVLVAAFDSITESGLPAAYHMHAPLYARVSQYYKAVTNL